MLIFLPGWEDISKLQRMLSASYEFGHGSGGRFKILPLHSGISKQEQNQCFHSLAPGEHKIILATNIAETSITIEDVTAVIDSGKVREKVYDPHTKLTYLKSSWISKASAKQRRGRAGRVQKGVCYKLFSSVRMESLSPFQDSELLRMPLEELVLQIKVLNFAPGKGDEDDGVTSFLLSAIEAPHPLSISNAVALLKSIDCLDENEQLTAIGASVAQLPLNPRVGRLCLMGCIFGCGPAALGVAGAMGYRDPFLMPARQVFCRCCCCCCCCCYVVMLFFFRWLMDYG